MKSMTGYGTGQCCSGNFEVTVDLKTVNHRFLDISMRLPHHLAYLEKPLRDTLSPVLSRGHVDVFVSLKNTASGMKRVQVDSSLAIDYLNAAGVLEKLGASGTLPVYELLKLEGVTTLEDADPDQELIIALCTEAAHKAALAVDSMRAEEGRNLERDLRFHLNEVSRYRSAVLQRAPSVVADYRTRLTGRINSLLTDGADPARIAQEVALMADRCAIDEELSRLDSHISQMTLYLSAGDEIGKKMDFLIQEMNREANTIGSKASDAEIAQLVVDMKSEIEKLREQIQNVQ